MAFAAEYSNKTPSQAHYDSRQLQPRQSYQIYDTSRQNKAREYATKEYDHAYHSFDSAPVPRTPAEQYWAYRAIVAETKLAERHAHANVCQIELEFLS